GPGPAARRHRPRQRPPQARLRPVLRPARPPVARPAAAGLHRVLRGRRAVLPAPPAPRRAVPRRGRARHAGPAARAGARPRPRGLVTGRKRMNELAYERETPRAPDAVRPGREPFLSVIVPVRNEAAFVGETLDQLLAQRYDPRRFEVLVADGGSTAGT